MRGGFRIDVHLHTSRYSLCAECLHPDDLPRAAERAGLAGVVLTDHDMLWTAEEVAALQSRMPGVRVFRGIECTVRGAHLVVIGMDDAAPLYRGMPFEAAVQIAHRAGAAVVLAHPFLDSNLEALPLSLVDAVEVASTSFTAVDARRAWRLARRLGKPPVAGSDAHALAVVGWAWTELEVLPRDELELAEALRSGKGKPGRRGRFPRPREGSKE